MNRSKKTSRAGRCRGGRPPAFRITRGPDFRLQPAEGQRWKEQLPRYGALWELLTWQEDSARTLCNKLNVTAEELRVMLTYMESLGALSQTLSETQTALVLRKLPPVSDFNTGDAEEDGAPSPWHRNSEMSPEAFQLCAAWRARWRQKSGRVYNQKRTPQEMHNLRQLMYRHSIGAASIAAAMHAFLDEAHEWGHLVRSPVPGSLKRSEETRTGLKLFRYKAYRRFGPTLLTFCHLYADIADQLGALDRLHLDGDERRLKIGRAAPFRRRSLAGYRAKPNALKTR